MITAFLCGIAVGIWTTIILYILFRYCMDRKAPERPVASDKRPAAGYTVPVDDTLMQDAELSFTFDTDAERKAFILGVEQGRDSTVTAMKLRNQIPATADLDFAMHKGGWNEGRDAG